MLLLTLLASSALATDWRGPNTLIGVGVAPWGATLRGEAWLATELTGELGVGLRDFDASQPVGDWALRWRPRFACFGCGTRLLATFGVGVGGSISPDFDGGPWALGVGPDLVVSGVYWTSRSMGVQITGRVGLGPTLLTDDFEIGVVDPWYMISAGLAF